jgi:hypothetical protein
VAALTLALAAPLLASAPVQAAPPAARPAPAVVAPAVVSIGCDTPIRPCLSLRDVICWEDNWCRVPVVITPYTAQPIRVGYATKDGTAVAGLNYEPVEGVLSIEPRAQGATVPVFVRSSRTTTGEPATLSVTLFAPTAGILVADTATVTIVVRPATNR